MRASSLLKLTRGVAALDAVSFASAGLAAMVKLVPALFVALWCLPAQALGAQRPPFVATAARTLAFNINSNVHLAGRPGHVLNERGTFSGSQSGTIEIRFTSVSRRSGEATFAAYSSRGGSVSGRASTRGHVVGATVYFTGSMTITGGTGRWAHASGRGLGFSGAVDRHTFNATTHTQGAINV
jgi:hypothetical protein